MEVRVLARVLVFVEEAVRRLFEQEKLVSGEQRWSQLKGEVDPPADLTLGVPVKLSAVVAAIGAVSIEGTVFYGQPGDLRRATLIVQVTSLAARKKFSIAAYRESSGGMTVKI